MDDRFEFRAWDGSRMYYDAAVGNNTCAYAGHQFFQIKKPQAIMQCTGLRDKNGKLIFEGDVVKGYFERSGEKPKKKHEATVEVIYKAPFHGLAGFQIWPINFDEFPIEIIGNIYENQELLDPPHDK